MKIIDHRLEGAPFVKANASGGAFPAPPDLIVLHDTAGRLDPGNSVKWFASKKCDGASAHFVVERDGSITQQVMLNRVAWHAGASTYKGRSFCNSFSFGIEIVNPGLLTKQGDRAKAWFDETWPIGEVRHAKTAEHGDGYWMDYTPAQIEAVTELCRALAEAYPIKAITTHWFISPRRKIDTNPLFPLEQVAREALAPKYKLAPAGEALALVSDERGETPAEHLVIPAADPPKPEPEQKTASVTALLDTSDRHFAILNRLSELGSRVATVYKRGKQLVWSALGGLGLLSQCNTQKGTASLLSEWAHQHPFLLAAISVSTVLVAVYFLILRPGQKYLVTAFKDGRYTPRG
jgi:N-acetylmuramoyl-L-alanine amidase